MTRADDTVGWLALNNEILIVIENYSFWILLAWHLLYFKWLIQKLLNI